MEFLMMDLKALYQRFRAWQKDPVQFKISSEGAHRCVNCGNTFEGDYCPVCGQHYSVGRADWGMVIRDFKEFQGVSAGSVLLFLLQMLGRPGYLISDYIRGRRQVCGDPISVLCFTAMVVLLVTNLFGKAGADAAISTAGTSGLMAGILNWLNDHLEWAIIIETILLVFPTWLLFRFSPKHTLHSIPEGVYIQLFMGSLVLLLILLRTLLGKWILVLVPIYYYIAYRQLFGYGVWSTLWRTVLCLGIIFYFFGIAMMVSMRISKAFWAQHTTWEFLSMFGAFLLLGAGILYLGYWIGKKTARNRDQSTSR